MHNTLHVYFVYILHQFKHLLYLLYHRINSFQLCRQFTTESLLNKNVGIEKEKKKKTRRIVSDSVYVNYGKSLMFNFGILLFFSYFCLFISFPTRSVVIQSERANKQTRKKKMFHFFSFPSFNVKF